MLPTLDFGSTNYKNPTHNAAQLLRIASVIAPKHQMQAESSFKQGAQIRVRDPSTYI